MTIEHLVRRLVRGKVYCVKGTCRTDLPSQVKGNVYCIEHFVHKLIVTGENERVLHLSLQALNPSAMELESATSDHAEANTARSAPETSSLLC